MQVTNTYRLPDGTLTHECPPGPPFNYVWESVSLIADPGCILQHIITGDQQYAVTVVPGRHVVWTEKRTDENE